MNTKHGMNSSLANLIQRTCTEGDECNTKFHRHFGRLFEERTDQNDPEQKELFPDEKLSKLADSMFPDDDGTPDDMDIPVGFAFFGQFIDHDITLDATTKLGQAAGTPEHIENFRTPRLDLDSVYLNGPEASSYLYYPDPDKYKLVIGTDSNPIDIPRIYRNGEFSKAIIGDPRNDENIFIAQIQSLFIRFHNHVVDLVKDEVEKDKLFEEARNRCRWLYQWIVVNEFLPAVVHRNVLDPYMNGFSNGQLPGPIDWNAAPFMPVEFSAAAYRFGHSLIRQKYRVNDKVEDDLFTFGSFKPIAEEHNIDWKYLLDFDGQNYLHAKAIDTVLPAPLKDLPFIKEGDIKNLAVRNMIRGQHTLLLPTGEDAAKYFAVPPVGKHQKIAEAGLEETPLWFYVLAEAEFSGGKLGSVGGGIVAGTLLRLILADGTSYVHAGADHNFDPYQLLGINDPNSVHSVFAEMARIVSSAG